jgi:hypothetical protein
MDEDKQTKKIFITPEVSMDDKILFLIRQNGEELAFTNTSNEAILIVDSIAASEQKRLSNEWTKVYRQDLDENRKVIISTQALGYITNGAITKCSVIDFIPVGRATPVKNRYELTEEGNVVVPVAEVLQKLATLNIATVKEESSDDSDDDSTEDSSSSSEDEKE